jgi:metallo-beta-lactamase family protein
MGHSGRAAKGRSLCAAAARDSLTCVKGDGAAMRHRARQMDLQFLGATGTVTGSRYLLRAGGASLLVDCGLFQGFKQLRLRNWAVPPVDVKTLDAVVLTHAHLDHSGYLPRLVKAGYAGPVHCTSATYDLCRLLLPDSGRLQEEEAELANRHGFSRHAPALPLYTEADAVTALERFEVHDFDEEFAAAPGLALRFLPAGHILGAAMVLARSAARSVLFSGDLGRPHDAIMRAPARIERADAVVVESTYGDRAHDPADPQQRLGEVIARTVARNGVVVIPSFAVGRTQTLLWAIHRLKAARTIPGELPVFLNSPMAVDATAIYRRHRAEHRLSPEDCLAMCHAARFVNTVEESKRLNERRGPMVILAGSGMATGGRVVHHLKAFAPDPRNTILFAGFQAAGTRGAAMLGGAETVKIHGAYVPVRAEVAQLDNLSAHADAQEILAWLGGFTAPPARTFVTHGEPAAADALRQRIEEQLRWRVDVPEYLERVTLG